MTTFRQTRIPPGLMGRVGAAGQALSARLGERTGLAIALVIAVAGSSALAVLGGRSFHEESRPDLVG